jgi:hypothetical protein
MLVRMRIAISGGRHDGRPWPEAGHPIDLPDWEALDVIRGGMAVPHGEDDERRYAYLMVNGPDAPVRVPGSGDGTVVSMPAATAAGPLGVELAVPSASPAGPGTPGDAGDTSREAAADAQAAEALAGHDAGGPPGEPAEQAAEPAVAVSSAPAVAPSPSAPKQYWIDWAIAQDADPEQAAAMTKADLMSRYGGRL